jgi:D-methionine transport system permease protein
MNPDLFEFLGKAVFETLYMVFFSSLIAAVIGIPLGVLLTVSASGHILESKITNKALGGFVNIIRSFPSVILIVVLLPLTRFIVGTSIGINAALVPLSICAAPFIARLVETSLKEVNKGKIEASLSMGATPWQTVYKVLIPEALPSIIRNLTLSAIMILGLTAIAGVVGAGGLGSLAIRFGYMRYRDDIMFATVVALLIIVQLIQFSGDYIAKLISKRRHVYE